MCNPRHTNREHKKVFAFSSMPRLNQDQDTIQINNNAKTLAMGREQYWFNKRSENPRGCSKPKWEDLPLIRITLSNKSQKMLMMLDNRNV